MANRSICMLGRLALVVFCVVGLGAASPIMFRDNFNRSTSAANWEMVEATWTFERGKLIGTADESGDAWIYVASKKFPGNIEIRVSYDVTGTDSSAEIVFNSTGHLLNEYRVGLASKEGSLFSNRWVVQTYKDGVQGGLVPPDATDVIDNTIPSPFPIPTRGHFTIRRLGNTISLYVNGRKVGSVTDSDPLPAQGRVGLALSGATTTYDNFAVRIQRQRK
jgi:hypothetical protein